MWQPTQYYHTKMQLARMELEGKLLDGKYRKSNRKTGSGPIMEKMRMLQMTDEADDGDAADWYVTEEFPEQDVQGEEMILESQSPVQTQETEISEEVFFDMKRTSGKEDEQEQEHETEIIPDAVDTEKTEQVSGQNGNDMNVQLLFAEQLQDRMIWAEILGEPVSVKRRKKKVEQLYGNRGHAYRR